MRIYISMDAEGISGIYTLEQVMLSGRDYQHSRKLMAGDINAAVKGAFDGGARDVFVNDAHNRCNNLLISDLDSRIVLCSGSDKPLTMAQGAEKKFDAALLIGYHARKGSKGVISHSYSYGSMMEIKLNGQIISEVELVGHVCGYFGTPVIFVSGDDIVTSATKKFNNKIYTVTTKECIGNGAAVCKHPDITSKEISLAVEEAVKNFKNDNIEPMKIRGDVNIDVKFCAESQARNATLAQNAHRIDELTVRFSGKDYLEAYMSFVAGASLGGIFRDDAALYT